MGAGVLVAQIDGREAFKSRLRSLIARAVKARGVTQNAFFESSTELMALKRQLDRSMSATRISEFLLRRICLLIIEPAQSPDIGADWQELERYHAAQFRHAMKTDSARSGPALGRRTFSGSSALRYVEERMAEQGFEHGVRTAGDLALWVRKAVFDLCYINEPGKASTLAKAAATAMRGNIQRFGAPSEAAHRSARIAVLAAGTTAATEGLDLTGMSWFRKELEKAYDRNVDYAAYTEFSIAKSVVARVTAGLAGHTGLEVGAVHASQACLFAGAAGKTYLPREGLECAAEIENLRYKLHEPELIEGRNYSNSQGSHCVWPGFSYIHVSYAVERETDWSNPVSACRSASGLIACGVAMADEDQDVAIAHVIDAANRLIEGRIFKHSAWADWYAGCATVLGMQDLKLGEYAALSRLQLLSDAIASPAGREIARHKLVQCLRSGGNQSSATEQTQSLLEFLAEPPPSLNRNRWEG